MKGEKTITLKDKRGGEHQFTFPHALNLLRLQASKGRKGWVVSDKNYKFENNEIVKRTSSTTSQKPETKD